MRSSHTLDELDTCFDDTHAVADAGLLVAATLGERAGAYRPGPPAGLTSRGRRGPRQSTGTVR
jgi:hypothetical protein